MLNFVNVLRNFSSSVKLSAVKNGLSVLRLYIKQHVKQTICTQNSCSSVRWLMFSIFFTRLAAMSRVVSFFCSEKQTLLLHVCTIQQYGTLFSFMCFGNVCLKVYNSHCFLTPQWPQRHCGSDRAPSGWWGSEAPQFSLSDCSASKCKPNDYLLSGACATVIKWWICVMIPGCLKQWGCVKRPDSEALLFY